MNPCGSAKSRRTDFPLRTGRAAPGLEPDAPSASNCKCGRGMLPRMYKFLAVTLLALPLVAATDRELVEAASFGYIDAIYQNDPSKVAAIAHPELSKRGFWKDRSAGLQELKMDFAGLEKVAERWNAGKKRDLSQAPRRVDIYEVLDQTASVKVTAAWGVDYLLLAKYQGQWKIVSVLWQYHPQPVAGAQ